MSGLDPSVITGAKLSSLQLESVAYAKLRFSRRLADGARCILVGGRYIKRCGFFIGDGAGMGKGRQ